MGQGFPLEILEPTDSWSVLESAARSKFSTSRCYNQTPPTPAQSKLWSWKTQKQYSIYLKQMQPNCDLDLSLNLFGLLVMLPVYKWSESFVMQLRESGASVEKPMCLFLFLQLSKIISTASLILAASAPQVLMCYDLQIHLNLLQFFKLAF